MNEGGWIALAVSAFAVVMVTVFAVQHYRERERRDRLQAAAQTLGFSFQPEVDTGLLGSLSHLALFSQGRSKKINNVMRKMVAGVDVTLFDYRYTTGSGKHSDIRSQTVLLFQSGRLDLPAFVLRPEHVFHRLAGALGYQDLDFEAYPVFSQTYLLQGPDEAGIRDLFSDPVLAYYSRHTGLSTEGQGQLLVYYRARKRVDPAQIGRFVEEGLDVLALFFQEEELLASLALIGASLELAQEAGLDAA